MEDFPRSSPIDRDVEQAITALKKGACLLKYGRRGKPKFCPFRLSNDESILLWHSGKDEKRLKLNQVSRIIPGQRTAIFQRYPRPEKEYQSFSLIYNDRSLDLICKDKDEAEVWFVGLKALVLHGNYRKLRSESKCDRDASFHYRTNSDLSFLHGSPDIRHKDPGDTQHVHVPYGSPTPSGLGKAFADVMLYTAAPKGSNLLNRVGSSRSSFSSGGAESFNGRASTVDVFRVSLSSAVSSSSQGSSCQGDFDALGDVYIWGEGTGDGLLGGCMHRVGSSITTKIDALLPKALESAVMLDVLNIACGSRHAALVTRQGEVFSWGQETGGRLGHGVGSDVSQPKLVDALSCMNVEFVACGEYHTCAVTLSGDLYTWGDGTINSGLLGHGNDVSHWIPKKVIGHMDGIHVSAISCGPWHTAVVTSTGQLFTFGDGTFGALGHGDRRSSSTPREVESLKGLRAIRASCGVWHTAAVVEVMIGSSSNFSSGKLFTWGDGDKGRLGHGDSEPRLVPACVAALVEVNFRQVACGHDITLALTTLGQVYTMGSKVHGQLGSPEADGKVPTCIEGNIRNTFVEEIACGSYHVAILTSRTEVYTWGKGANGRLGHGDKNDRNTPTLVESLKDKQVKSVVCGTNFTAAICLHKWVSTSDQSICSGCHNLFGFRRKRHNCYNCGLVFCKACSSKKSLKASLAPNVNKPYRVCDDCYTKLKAMEAGLTIRRLKSQARSSVSSSSEGVERQHPDLKLYVHTSKLSSIESFKKNEGRHSKHNRKFESSNYHISVSLNRSYHGGSFCSSRSSNSMLRSSKKIFYTSVLGAKIVPQARSSILRRHGPQHSITQSPTPVLVANDSRKTNDNLTQEGYKLRAQVEDLTHKSKLLQVELEKTSKQLKEATAIAGEEAAKCHAAKEVIKSLTGQLKDVAERKIPEGSVVGSKSSSVASHALNVLNLASGDNHLSYLAASHDSKPNDHLSNLPFRRGSESPTEEADWVEHDERGVYITLSSLPGGGMEIKRVRFSRKHFREQEAEKWWAENRARLFDKYDIHGEEDSFTGSLPTSLDKNGATGQQYQST
ncbi:hypothetical protein MRB53_021912 [Persea americana]|uniref:Uncharacterized protein n=1 Tax=Persea americana TaxID=3435 RepID=A0ACC2L6D3_PERAE|nr:hypothetical protein MRB53_021912 [Persea americana]